MDAQHEEHPHSSGPPVGRPGPAQRWAAFKQSPYLPALVLLCLIALAAGLFAGSYTYSMADPTPHRLPVAVVGSTDSPKAMAFVDGMEKGLDASLQLHGFPSESAARRAVEEQRVFAILTFRPDSVHLAVASAAGSSVALLLTETAPRVARTAGLPLQLSDVKPLQRGDPRGLALFYISLAAVIVGFVGAIQLSVHAAGLTPLERIGVTVAYALLAGFTIAAVVDGLLGALRLPFFESWGILALSMFAAGMFFNVCNVLMGRWALAPTWGLLVLLGTPSSGGAVSWPLLPSVLGTIGRWLPTGASINAQHTAVYFGDAQHIFPFAVLTGWAVGSTAIFWVFRRRHAAVREDAASTAPADGAGGRGNNTS